MHKHRDERWANADEFLAQLSDETPATPGVGPVAVIRDGESTADVAVGSSRPDRAAEQGAGDSLPRHSTPLAPTPSAEAREILPEPAVDTPTIRLSRTSEALEAQDAVETPAEAPARPAAAAAAETAEPVIRVAARGAGSGDSAAREAPFVEPDLDEATVHGTTGVAPPRALSAPLSPTAAPAPRAPAAARPIVVRGPRRFRPIVLLIPLAVAAALALFVAQRERSAQRREDAVAALDTLSTTASGGTVVPRDSTRARPTGPRAGTAASARNRSTPATAPTPSTDPAAAPTGPRGAATTDSLRGKQPSTAAVAGAANAGIPAARRILRTRADSIAACDSPALADQRACLYVHIAANDVELNRVYGDLIAALRARAGTQAQDGDPPAVRQLRVEQRAWLVERDVECRRRTGAREGALWARVRANCLGEMSDRRAQELAATLNRVRG